MELHDINFGLFFRLSWILWFRNRYVWEASSLFCGSGAGVSATAYIDFGGIVVRREIPRWEPTVLHGVLHKDPLALRGSDPLIQIVFVPTVLHFCKHSILTHAAL